jgi:hypothetical protein
MALLVLERVEAAARVVDLEDPLRSIAPVEEILPLRVLEPEPPTVSEVRVALLTLASVYDMVVLVISDVDLMFTAELLPLRYTILVTVVLAGIVNPWLDSATVVSVPPAVYVIFVLFFAFRSRKALLDPVDRELGRVPV